MLPTTTPQPTSQYPRTFSASRSTCLIRWCAFLCWVMRCSSCVSCVSWSPRICSWGSPPPLSAPATTPTIPDNIKWRYSLYYHSTITHSHHHSFYHHSLPGKCNPWYYALSLKTKHCYDVFSAMLNECYDSTQPSSQLVQHLMTWCCLQQQQQHQQLQQNCWCPAEEQAQGHGYLPVHTPISS